MTPDASAPTTETLDALAAALGEVSVRRFRDGVYRALQPACGAITLRDGTHPLLLALADGPGTAAALSPRIGVDRSVTSRQASALVDSGLATRTPDPADARGSRIALTPEGEATAAGLRTATRQLLADALADLPEADLAACTRVLSRLVKAVTA